MEYERLTEVPSKPPTRKHVACDPDDDGTPRWMAVTSRVHRTAGGRFEWYVKLKLPNGRVRGWGGSRLTAAGARQSVADRLYRIDLGLV